MKRTILRREQTMNPSLQCNYRIEFRTEHDVEPEVQICVYKENVRYIPYILYTRSYIFVQSVDSILLSVLNWKFSVYCQRVGCDLKIGSAKKVDECGVCGGDGGSCSQPLYHWEIAPMSLCSVTCGGGKFLKFCIIVYKIRALTEFGLFCITSLPNFAIKTENNLRTALHIPSYIPRKV